MNKSKNEKPETRFADLASVFGFEDHSSVPSVPYHNSEFSNSEISGVIENVVSEELAVWNDEENEEGFLSQLEVEFDPLAVNGLVDSNSTDVDEGIEEDEEKLPEEYEDDDN